MRYTGTIIDSHIHIRGGFDDLGSFMAGMDALRSGSGVEKVAIASVPLWDAECIGQNVISLAQKAAYPRDTFVLAGLDYHLPQGSARVDFLSQAREYMAMGCDGIKMLEGKPTCRKIIGGIPLDSELYDGLYAYLEREQVPLLLHSADPETFWDERLLPDFARRNGWGYQDGSFAPYALIQEETERVLDRFPGLKVSLAHFYFVSEDIDRAARILERHPNVSYDLTPGTEMYTAFSARRGEWRDFFTRYAARIIFGTDNGWGTFTPMEEKIRKAADFVGCMRRFLETADAFTAFTGFDIPIAGLDLDRPALESIYLQNFCRFASPAPRPLDKDRVIAYAERLVGAFGGVRQKMHELPFPQMEQCLERFKAAR
jgi:predicted TIM-barrel fold metal-dependent hydrolase